MGSRQGTRLLAICLVLAVGACGTTEQSSKAPEPPKQVKRTIAKNPPPPPGKPHKDAAPLGPGGIYKVGNPYKVGGVWYYPAVDPGYDETGVASWYGPKFHGKRTANGEMFDQHAITAAHKTLPLPSWVEVTNLKNNKTLIVRVNDRGPYAHNRILDLSRAAANELGFLNAGTTPVRVRVVAPRTVEVAEATHAEPAPPEVRADHSPRLFVQVGAFSDPLNAKALADRLGVSLGAGHSVMLSPAVVAGRTMVRVRLGPISDVDQADATLAQVLAQGYSNARIIVD